MSILSFNFYNTLQVKHDYHYFRDFLMKKLNFFYVQKKPNEVKILVDKSLFSQRFFWGEKILLMERNKNSEPKPST